MSTIFKAIKRINNPFLLFSPFLVGFIIYVLVFPTTGHFADEPRFLRYAGNLWHGFYSPPFPNIDLRNGPGYPLLIMPIVGLKLPLIFGTLLNAIMHYLSIVFIFKSLQKFVSYRKALIFSLFWGCYYIAYQNLPIISYEPLSIFLVSLLIFCILNAFDKTNLKKAKRYTYLAGFVLGYLALTKFIFGYIIVVALIVGAILWIGKRSANNYRKGVIVCLIAFLTTIPYLVYTYNLTGKFFYWGTNGYDSLYWMSTPYENEYGDWKLGLETQPVYFGNFNTIDAGDSVKAHHGKDFAEIFKYTGVKQGEVFKKIAIQNIKSHPLKFAKNVFYNIGRMVFHYPFSFAVQRPKVLFVFPLNGIILTLTLLSLIPTLLFWRKILYPLRFLLMITLLYLGASALLPAYTRMFAVIVPVLLFWAAYIMENSIKINFRFKKE